MQITMDLVRAILLVIEEDKKERLDQVTVSLALSKQFPNGPTWTNEQLVGHVRMMREEGLVEAKIIDTMQGSAFIGLRMKGKGGKFLNNVRNDTIWDKVKEKDDNLTISSILEMPKKNQTPTSSAAQENGRTNTNEVFVIHGRDEGTRAIVTELLRRLGLVPVILAEQANQGRTIIEKFERHAQVEFAVALLTPDDAGSLQDDGNTLNPRARQNVVFELGFFIGKLGRERVCALTKGDVEIPSDYAGVVYIPLDDRGWKMDLVRELQSAGYDVDANKAL